MLVLYASDYGFSDRLSQSLAAGITKAGVATEMMDLLSADPQARGAACVLCVVEQIEHCTARGRVLDET